ncbi:MAG: sensor histidine kinase [Rhodomicrobium sp.]
MEQPFPAPAAQPGSLTAALQRFAVGLPARLLLLTVAFVMVAEIFIFVPSVADFRRNWLMQRVEAAKIASLALEASGGAQLPERLRHELLTTAGVHAVSVKRSGLRLLVLGMPDETRIAGVYDLRSETYLTLMLDGMKAFLAPPGRLIRVIGSSGMMASGGEIDAVIDETPLRAALWHYAGNIFWLTLLISMIAAALVYLTILGLLVRPMMRITRNMVSYRENPEDTARIIVPSGRSDEIGVAEKELATLQTQLTGFLREKARLASVGLAVSKINHDLRNMLAGAQLVSDRLASVADPTVQRFVPRLIRALDRAIDLCTNTVNYGSSEEAPPRRAPFALRPLIAEVNESLGTEELSGVKMTVSVPAGLDLLADRDQIFRVLSNLIRNSLEAFQEADPAPAQPAIDITALREGDIAILRVSDNGPGIPTLVRKNLFKAFQAGTGNSGAGLGLAISAELVRAHGGDIALDEADSGAAFVLQLPAVARDPARKPPEAEVFDGKLAQDGFSR